MMNADDYYAEAIDIVANPDTDWKALVLALAKINPKALVKAYIYPLRCEALRVFKAEGIVPAIKRVRTLRSMSLLEAKIFVEAAISYENEREDRA